MTDSAATKKKDVGARRFFAQMTFSQSLMVTVDVSKSIYTSSILVDPGVKINEICYCELVLSQRLLPAVRQIPGEFSKQFPRVRITLVY